ncbi:hypothetical protein AOLI_G00019730 [Acnodon oligacanthus]
MTLSLLFLSPLAHYSEVHQLLLSEPSPSPINADNKQKQTYVVPPLFSPDHRLVAASTWSRLIKPPTQSRAAFSRLLEVPSSSTQSQPAAGLQTRADDSPGGQPFPDQLSSVLSGQEKTGCV